MKRIKKILLTCSLVLFCEFLFSQGVERNISKQLGVSVFGQLSSTKYATGLSIDYFKGKNLFYVGAKIPVPFNDVYGAGVVVGYGRQLIGNEILKIYFIPDIQWLSSKTQNQIKRTQYFDFTLNYELCFVKIKNFAFCSSFGYGLFLKRYYRNDLKEMQSSSGLSGLVKVRIAYFIINKIPCKDCPSVH